MRIVVLVGSSGVGKTAVAASMMEHLEGWDCISLEREMATGGGYRSLVRKIENALVPTILEIDIVTPVVRKALLVHDVTVVEVTCSERERRRRLELAGKPISKSVRQQHHLVFDTTQKLPGATDCAVMAGRPSGKHLATA